MGKPFRVRTLQGREKLESVQRGHRFVAAMCADPDKRASYESQFVKPIPPKRDKIRRPVDGRPVGPTEHQEQSAVIQWWGHACHGYGLPEFSLFAIPNGGARDVVTGARLKAEGVRRGVFDLMLAKRTRLHAGLFIEMKVGDNKPSAEQENFKAFLMEQGYLAAVHWSSGSAIEEIKAYLA